LNFLHTAAVTRSRTETEAKNPMQNPTVTFVVPCYKLAHLLTECINSILSQTFSDFEVLIMDDCSPDNTSEVANSFNDSRVRHIRNDPNLGHLCNYNKGITLARGRYIWLISADDYLREPYVLERYVDVMTKNANVGYSFCPVVSVRDKQELGVVEYSVLTDRDCIVDGYSVLRKLLNYNIVPAASGMVRRELYERHGLFPLKFPHVGDWYLWAIFAFNSKVAYFSEPMVCYREHNLSMTTALSNTAHQVWLLEEIELFWLLKDMADKIEFRAESKGLLNRLANNYAKLLSPKNEPATLTLEQLKNILAEKNINKKEKRWFFARVYGAVGDLLYWQGDHISSKNFYLECLKNDLYMEKTLVKFLLLSFGKYGEFLRGRLSQNNT